MKHLKIVALLAIAFAVSTAAFAVSPDAFLAPDADPAALTESAATLSPAERETIRERIRFEMLQEGRSDLASRLELLQAARATAPLTRDNLLGIPLRVGTLELKVLFTKKRGAILRCDKQGFIATLDSYRIETVADPQKPGRALATFSGDPQLPAKPIGATIKTTGDTVKILGDDGTTVEATFKSDGSYSFKTNKAPVTVTARYID